MKDLISFFSGTADDSFALAPSEVEILDDVGSFVFATNSGRIAGVILIGSMEPKRGFEI